MLGLAITAITFLFTMLLGSASYGQADGRTASDQSTLFSVAASPDLIVTDIAWNVFEPRPGNNLKFTAYVANQGSASTSAWDPFDVAFFIDGTQVEQKIVSNIGPGVTIFVDFYWTATAGNHTVKMVADYGDYIPEGNEANNERSESFSVSSANTPPTLELTGPANNITVQQGDEVLITWTDSDPDDNAYISLARDTDTDPTNGGGHTWLTISLREDPDGSGDQYTWDTTSVPPGTYYIWGMIYDAVNPEVYDVAPGRVTITQPQASWLLLYYMSNGSGSDMESGIETKFRAIAQGAGNASVRAYLLWDHLSSEDRLYRMKENGDWSSGYTHEVDYWTATDIGLSSTEMDMGDVNTLNKFVDFVLAREQADHYALIIFNHGSGVHPTVTGGGDDPIITGIAFDDSNYLSIQELGLGTAHLKNAIGRRFEILHLDACLMQMSEINYEVRDNSEYVIASENEGWTTTGGTSWEDDYINDITQTTSALELANAIATAYFNRFAGGRTISVLDTSRVNGVVSAVDGLANAVINNMRAVRNDLQLARNDAQKFAYFDICNTMTRSNIFLDLKDLARKIRGNVSVGEVRNAADAVIAAVGDPDGDFVTLERHQTGAGPCGPGYDFDTGTFGVSIFFPESTSPSGQNTYWNYINESSTPANLAFCASTRWDEFLRTYLEWKVLKVSTSGASDVAVNCTMDRLGNGDGTTTFTRLYESGATISLTAPASAGGAEFLRWNRNGSSYSTDRTVSFSMNEDFDLEAVYGSPATGGWATKAPMPTARDTLAAVTFYDGKIYVIGGSSNSGPTSIVEAYDPATDSWSSRTPLPGAKSSAGAAVINGRIYVVGGDNRLYAYDPFLDIWAELAPLPVGSAGHVAVGVVNGKMYVSNGSDWMYCYDPATNTWTPKTPVTVTRSIDSFAVLNGKLYAVGGGEPGHVPGEIG
jgi:hypothetical protein